MKFKYTKIACLVAATTLLAACGDEENREIKKEIVHPVKLVTIDSQDTSYTVSFPATLSASQEAELSFRIGGQLMQLVSKEGAPVEKGDVVAALDNRDAKNALATAQSNYDLAKIAYDRTAKLYKKKLTSKSEFDTAKANLTSTQAALSTAKDQLEYTRLIAPFSGQIAKINTDNHQMVQAGQSIVSLQSVKTLDVKVQVPENILLFFSEEKVKTNLKSAVVKFAKTNRTYPAIFKEFATKVTPGTQAYDVTFSMQQPDDLNVFGGMSAKLLISGVDKPNYEVVAIVPLTAVVNDDTTGENFVWIYDAQAGVISKRVIELGQARKSGVEVLSGVMPGEEIVAVGAKYLNKDAKVRPIQWERGI